MQRGCLYTEALGKLVIRLVVRPNGILGEKLASNLQLEFKLSRCCVCKVFFVLSAHWAVESVPRFSREFCYCRILLQSHKTDFNRVRARETLIKFLSVELADWN